ncbi:hypothetical protein M407DRAFT_6730 [Tulasnella calospora MUT 4182]|uniref:Retrotransposon gag domain-containing protein n=1 Tax=Tulasnella calospora MUT 4182 TaxID=1051891 RepID=A0A0C3QCR4_9AGAM|nr:hypothetical protein M407DRAFT_6730 [Tulasnella calospora MUT 4182]
MSALEEIVFDGGEGQCERFIRLVRKAAFSQGKLDDSKWVAMFASTCFEGKALRWYSALDPTTKTDWHLLEPALLNEFTGPVLSSQVEEKAPSIERESSMPTPAAAPPPPPSAEEQESLRPSSPTSYEPTPAPAPAAAPPPSSIFEGRPWPPPNESSPQSKPGPPPPPPPRNSTFTPSYQPGSGFRPPPRHPSASASSSSKSGPSPGLYGSFIPTANPSAPPPPPPRNSFTNSQRPQEQWEQDVPKPTEPRRYVGSIFI